MPRKKKKGGEGEEGNQGGGGDYAALVPPTAMIAMAVDEGMLEPIIDDASNAVNEMCDLCYYEYMAGVCLGFCCVSPLPGAGVLDEAEGV